MTSPLAWLAGIGRGATTLGTSLDQDEEKRRELAQIALQRMLSLNQIGGQVIPQGQSDQDATINALRPFGEARTPKQLEALGPEPDLNIVSLPGLQGGTDRILIDPSKSAASQAASRAMQQLILQNKLTGQRQEEGKQADYKRAIDLETLKANLRGPQNPVMGSQAWLRAQGQLADIRAEHAPNPTTYVTGVNDAGKPEIYAGTTRGTPKLTPMGVGKPQSMGGIAQVGLGRANVGLNDMEIATEEMPKYEAKIRAGTANYTGLDQFIKDVGNDFALPGAKADAERAIALTRLNKVNPELARYIRWGLKYAEGESMISQRPSDFRTKMAAFLATAPTGASPEMLDDIDLGRRAQTIAMRKVLGGQAATREGIMNEVGITPSAAPAAPSLVPQTRRANDVPGVDPAFTKRALELNAALKGNKAAVAAQLTKEGWDIAIGKKKGGG